MKTKFIYTIRKNKTTVNEYTSDVEIADALSRDGHIVTCKRWRGI